MQLLNISNSKREVSLFTRDNTGKLTIVKDNSFFPFFYEPDKNGKFKAYDANVMLRKVFASDPQDIKRMRTLNSYSSDIAFTKVYLIHKVDKIDKAPIRYFFIDSEMKSEDLPNWENPKYPVTCITLYDSFTKEYHTWYIEEMKGSTLIEQEFNLLMEFITYFKTNPPDLWLSWNVDFDYNYIYARANKLVKEKRWNFAQQISPITTLRGSKEQDLFYPAGISILDYLGLFKKVFRNDASYALDYISQQHLNEKAWQKTDFSEISKDMKDKNINDVRRMVSLEDKYHLISYFDEIRRLSKAMWEDLYFNSFIVEMLLFEEAKNQNIVLPNNNRGSIKETFAGATREAETTGALFDIGKFDLTSAYPNMIVNFCLDTQNIAKGDIDAGVWEMNGGVTVNNLHFIQNSEALLPSTVRKILKLKDDIKKKLKSLDMKSEEYANTQLLYDAIKAVVNSCFGVFGFPGFRLYDNNIASTITYLVRDLLIYVKDGIAKEGVHTVYWDTDGLMVNTPNDISVRLNQLVREWGKKYGKSELSIDFEYEGFFKELFILTKCRYIGNLVTSKGIKQEIKGLEIKRASSSKYEKKFQKELINKILNKQTKEQILQWVNQEKRNVKNNEITEIAFPCKINQEEYKNRPIFVKAYHFTKEIHPKFKLTLGELFYYIYMQPFGKEITKAQRKDKIGGIKEVEIKKDKNVLAFTIDTVDFIDKELVDWNLMLERNIDSKVEKIFEAMKWTEEKANV